METGQAGHKEERFRVFFIGIGIGLLAILAVGAIFINLQTIEQGKIEEYRNTAQKLADLTMNFYLKKQYENIEDIMKVQTQTSAIQYMVFNKGGESQYPAGNDEGLEITPEIFQDAGNNEIKVVRKPDFLYLDVPFGESEDVIREKSSLLVVFSLEEFRKGKRNILWAVAIVVSLVVGLVVLFYLLDKTSRQLQQRNRELDETSRKLKQEERTKTGMIKAIAHDALHYVTVIQMINDNLSMQAKGISSGTEILPYVRDIMESNSSLTKLLEDLKYNEYLSRGLVMQKPELVDWVPFVNSVIHSLKEMFAKKNVQCEFFSDRSDYVVRIDESLIKRVIFNLLHNAFKFTRYDSKVKVWCAQDGGDVLTFVQDEGAGIPETDWEWIFEPSVRLEDNDFVRPEDKRGTGLGLSNSRKFVELYQGKLGVHKSAPNKGTTFCFSLPIYSADRTPSAGEKS